MPFIKSGVCNRQRPARTFSHGCLSPSFCPAGNPTIHLQDACLGGRLKQRIDCYPCQRLSDMSFSEHASNRVHLISTSQTVEHSEPAGNPPGLLLHSSIRHPDCRSDSRNQHGRQMTADPCAGNVPLRTDLFDLSQNNETS